MLSRSTPFTIVAPITPPGPGGVGVIRASGPAVSKLLKQHFTRIPAPRQFVLSQFLKASKQCLDEGLLLFFPAPHSFTGEDVFEFQGHGAPLLIELILQELIQHDEVRLAKPGEFSERAFLHGKLDLTQAEAIADLVSSQTVSGAEAALASLQGGFTQLLRPLLDGLLEIRHQFEAYLDFFEEQIEKSQFKQCYERWAYWIGELEVLLEQARQTLRLNSQSRWVLVGAPNVGKSTLFNQLLKCERAIVSSIPGTTRDTLKERLALRDVSLELVDTAGHRKTSDPLEKMGIERTLQAMREADAFIWVVDVSQPIESWQLSEDVLNLLDAAPFLLILNKSDMIDIKARAAWEKRIPRKAQERGRHWISARKGEGIEGLRAQIHQNLSLGAQSAHRFLCNVRHVELLERALQALQRGHRGLGGGLPLDVAAEELRLAQNCLGQITGQTYDERLLEGIFSKFCLGK